MNVNAIGYAGGFLYSCGLGQAIGIPCALIMIIKGIVHKILASIQKSNDSNECTLIKDDETLQDIKAKHSFKYARNFLIGMIPLVGGVIVIYRMIHKVDRVDQRRSFDN